MNSPDKSRCSEALRSVRIQVTTLGDLLLAAADRHPDSPALILPGERMTYGQLAESALRRARSLQALGIKPHDHVGLLLPTCFEFVEILFAIALCGAVAVPLNARYRHNELAYVIENGDLVAVFTTDGIAEQVNFVERLTSALPELRTAGNPRRLRLGAAPHLRAGFAIRHLHREHDPGFGQHGGGIGADLGAGGDQRAGMNAAHAARWSMIIAV